MTSSSLSLSMLSDESSELSIIGSCSNTKVVDSSISHSNVDVQEARRGARGVLHCKKKMPKEG